VKRVFIVEDDADIRDSVSELLESEGYGVATAVNGREALEQLRGAAELPGVILLDLMMPDMDGFQFREQQLADDRLRDIPVVLMSAGGELAAKAKTLGAAAHLKKPFFDLDTILQTLAQFF
jgi:CheY-like chemotaxis protein